MNLWHDVATGKNPPEDVNVIVEIQKGSQNKYEYNKEIGIFELNRVLYSSVHYPVDYGFIPQTLGEDKDPLDAIVLVTNPTLPGVLIPSRPIGVLKMVDSGEGDDKILCVPIKDPRFSHIKDIKDVGQATLDEISNFFKTYKQLENKKVDIVGWDNKKSAEQVILNSMKRFKKS